MWTCPGKAENTAATFGSNLSWLLQEASKKVKAAADVEYFSTISHQIHLCRADVSLHLALLQR
jgi:hypothetical protein